MDVSGRQLIRVIESVSLRSLLWTALIVMGSAAALELYAARHYPLADVVDFIFDDSYYYLGVAHNIARGAGSKFSEPLHTNGYQPLWLLLLTLGATIFKLTKSGLFLFTIALSHLVKMLAVAICLRAKNRDYIYVGLGLILCIGRAQPIFSWGLETTLLALGVPLLLWLLTNQDATVRHALLSGLCFGALLLVRLDCASLFVAYVAWSVLSERRADRLLAIQIAVVTSIAGTYFLANQVVYGVPVPVSGLAKSIGSLHGENTPIAINYLWSLKYVGGFLAISTLLVHCIGPVKARATSLFERPIAILAIACGITAAYYATFSGWPVWSWYHWPSAMLFIFSFARVLKATQLAWSMRGAWSPLRGASVLVTGAILAGIACLLVRKSIVENGAELLASIVRNERFESALLKKYFPLRPSFNKDNVALIEHFFTGDRKGMIAMGDRAGGLGYWLPDGYSFIHLEGLVGSVDFLGARKAGRGVQYVNALAPDFFVVDREQHLELQLRGRAIAGFPEPIQGLSAHSGVMLFCFPDDAVLYRGSFTRRDSTPPGVQVVYDYRRRVDCPTELQQKLDRLLAKYGALRRFSLPSEYGSWLRDELHVVGPL